MRILGDLDGDESTGRHDYSESRAEGKNGNHKEENSSRAAAGEPELKDGQVTEPRDQFRADVLGSEKGHTYAGFPESEPAAPPKGEGHPRRRGSDRIGVGHVATDEDGAGRKLFRRAALRHQHVIAARGKERADLTADRTITKDDNAFHDDSISPAV